MHRWLSGGRCKVFGWLMLGLGLASICALPCFAQQMHRNVFESNRTSWIKGDADAVFQETLHELSDQIAHEGQRSEHIQVNAKQGSFIHYHYPAGIAPISDDLTASVWVKANQPGIQLMARVVLPKEANPASLEDRLTTVVRGDIYRRINSWQRLEVGRPVKLAKEQQQLMQAQLGRPINFQDAYIDKLILNVFGGPGVTDVWIDELEIGPVYSAPATKPVEPLPNKFAPPASKPGAANSKFVSFNGSSLQVDGKPFLFLGIRHTDVQPKYLREAGFNTLFVDYPWDPARMREMVEQGFWLAPGLPVTSGDPRFASGSNLTQEVSSFPEPDSVIFHYLGTALGYEQSTQVANSATGILAASRQPIAADVWDGVARHSNHVQMVSFHRWPLMTTLELTAYRDWLEGKSRLANPGSFLWTWIQTHTPDDYTQLLYNKASSSKFSKEEPIGPQPEQIRLLTYLAVGSGFRGIGYWSDRFLADSHTGQDRLLTVALLNQELEFLEPLLTTTDGPPQWIDTNEPEVKAAVLRTQKGILVLPMWLGGSAQFVPKQDAKLKLTMTVPQVPSGFSCWEVTPGQVRSLKSDHGPSGGMKVTLPQFTLTTAVVFTHDFNLIQRFQSLCNEKRERAAHYTYDLAVEEMRKVAVVEEQLEKTGHSLPDAHVLMRDAYERLNKAKGFYDQHNFGEAYLEAQRALQPARIMMRAQWDAAVRELDTPVASPWAVSFYTLPRHWEFMNQVKASTPGANLIPTGDFEQAPSQLQNDWRSQEVTLDDVELRSGYVSQLSYGTIDAKTKKPGPAATLTAKEGKQFLVLEIKSKLKDSLAPRALERTYLAMTSPKFNLPPGSLVRISGWMAVPDNIKASPDGALLFDSAGGEPLGVRLATATGGWRHFTLYRQVPTTGPSAGVVQVTLALTGLGRVAFDDIRIEPLNSR